MTTFQSVTELPPVTDATPSPEAVDRLVWTSVFGKDAELRGAARFTLRTLAANAGIRPASIHDLYLAMGRGEASGFTVPAINVRMLAYDTARAVIRAAKKLNAGAFIFEIARSEIGYTEQRPHEYTAVVLGAALREGFRGPIFIQGDHVQTNAKKYNSPDRDKELEGLRALIREEMAAGFYNIDIDTSTLVDLDKATLDEQQEVNVNLAADFAAFIRQHEPKGVTVSVGGEIGEVGGKIDVYLLLFVERRLVEIDQRRGVDVDVIKAGSDLFGDQRAQPGQFLVAVGAVVLLGVGLDVVALNEDRSGKPFAQRGAEDDRCILVRTLLGVADFGAGDLEDERASVQFPGGADDGAGRVVRHRTHVDRRNREPARLAAAHRHIEVVDRCGADASFRRQGPEREPRDAAHICILAKHRRPHQAINLVGGTRSTGGGVGQFFHGFEGRHAVSP
jgi:hypothetical protein